MFSWFVGWGWCFIVCFGIFLVCGWGWWFVGLVGEDAHVLVLVWVYVFCGCGCEAVGACGVVCPCSVRPSRPQQYIATQVIQTHTHTHPVYPSKRKRINVRTVPSTLAQLPPWGPQKCEPLGLSHAPRQRGSEQAMRSAYNVVVCLGG